MTEHDFWEARYRHLPHNHAPLHPARQWQWHKILTHAPDLFQGTLLDVGCGDLTFWNGIDHLRYTGIDISDTVQQRNRQARLHWTFHTTDATKYQPEAYRADTVLCLNVLYHVLHIQRHNDILLNLNRWATKHLILYTWHKEPAYPYDHSYQAYHPVREDFLHHHYLEASYEQYPHCTLYIYHRTEVTQ